MNAVSFDTLAYAKKLECVGVPKQQAEVHAEILSEALEQSMISKQEAAEATHRFNGDMLTLQNKLYGFHHELKTDIAELKGEIAEVRGEIAEVRGEIAEVRGEIAEVRGEVAEVRTEVAELRSELKTDIAELRSELKIEISSLKTDIIKWTLSIGFAQTALVASLLKFLH